MVEMPHMHHVRFNLFQYALEGIVHWLVAISVPGPRHVDHMEGNSLIRRVCLPLQ